MKYYYTTNHKFLAFLLFAFSISFEIEAQLNTLSPYSSYGVGLVKQSAFNGNMGMSKFGIAWRPSNYRPVVYDSLAKSGATINDRSTNYINPSNPASFSNFSLTTYEVGLFSQSVTYSDLNSSSVENFAQFSHLAIGFPVGNRWGVAFGIKPLSVVGYDYSITETVNSQLVSNTYKGSGGINEIFAGTAVELNSKLSIGINFRYLFGSIDDERRVVYPNAISNGFFNTLDRRQTQISDIKVDLGLQYQRDIGNKSQIVAGLFISPFDNIDGEVSRIVRSYQGISGIEQFKDTIVTSFGEKVEVPIFSTYGAGLAYERKGKWLVGVDVSLRNWNDVSNEDISQLKNGYLVNVGFEKFTNQRSFGSYLKQLGYRAGFNYNSSLLNIDGVDIEQFGISFGLALPLSKSFSTLNFGIEFGQRGTTTNNLTKEEYINFQFGVTINDKWFIKRKFD
jgi:hypothetical protein